MAADLLRLILAPRHGTWRPGYSRRETRGRGLTTAQYIYCTSKYFLSLHELWTDFPDRELEGLVKGYVLAQWAFWVQQLLVIHMEERRKDHWQMFTHHIITNSLLFASYTYHFTRVGNLILVLMDVVDIFLPVGVPGSPFNRCR